MVTERGDGTARRQWDIGLLAEYGGERVSYGAEVVRDAERVSLIVVPWHGLVKVYHNRCPHTGVNLDWQPGDFLNLERNAIQCAVHGALFRMEDGLCVWGPCVGRSLREFAVTIAQGRVWVALPEKLEK